MLLLSKFSDTLITTPAPLGPTYSMAWFLCMCVFSVVGLGLLLLQVKLRRSLETRGGPPSLPVFPLIGSLLSLRSNQAPHVLFQKLQQKYGHTYSLMMGPHTVILVNHHQHAKEVLLKKGKIFAGRPRTVSGYFFLNLFYSILYDRDHLKSAWSLICLSLMHNNIDIIVPEMYIKINVMCNAVNFYS